MHADDLIRAAEELAAAARGTQAEVVELNDHIRLSRAVRAMREVCEREDRAPTDGQAPADGTPADGGWKPGDPVHGAHLDAELGAEGVSWSAQHLDADRAVELHDGEPAPAGWYVVGMEDPGEPESVLVSLFVDHAVRADGAGAGEAVARRLAALLSAGPAAAPADDTAAPDGPTADEAVASAARIVEAWAHLRMDTPEDQATHDELVRVSRATIAGYVRTRPWSSAGQPVRGSQPEAES